MQLDEVELIRYHLLVSQIVFGAGYCMVLYDWLCCLNREFKYIWKAKFSFIKVIYLFCRYWPIATVPYVLWAYTVPHTWETCQRIFRIPVAGSEAVLLARTVAFLGNSRVIFYSLSACLIAATAYQNWVVFKPMFLIPFIADDRFGVCLPSSPGNEILGYFLSSLAFDTLVTLLMIYRVFRLKREAGGQLSRTQLMWFLTLPLKGPLVQLFVSEGLWYFFVVSIANLVNGLMFAQKEKSLQATAVPFSNMLPPILACRLILDLREHGSVEGNAWLTTGKGNAGFILPAFLYRSKQGSAPARLSTMRFQNPDRPANPGASATDSTGVSTVSDIQFMNTDGVGQKTTLAGGLTSIRDTEDDGDDIVDARDVLVSAVKSNGDVVTHGVDNQFYVAYQMRPLRSQGQAEPKASGDEHGQGSLTTSMGFKLGPIMLSTLITHFLNRELATKDSKAREELLYDEAFIIVKSFMEASTKHTVEELQAFSNTRIPAPPWVRTVRVMIPLSSCDKAADKLIEALGGKEMATQVAGGTRWWQVRGLEGVPGEWIAVRKDIAAQRKRHKAEKERNSPLHRAKSTGLFNMNEQDEKQQEPHEYSAEMEGTPCMLYIHLSLDLYLLEPPEGAEHGPVDPSLIILAGDSAGGNITLALLTTVNREKFVSRLKQAVHRGLNPDESDGETITITERSRDARRMAAALPHQTTLLGDKISRRLVSVSQSSNEPDTPVQAPDPHGLQNRVEPGENATLLVDGKAVTIRSQVQFYAMNHQLTHPLVSPALAYLGGLPPCLFLASDKELLRDEIIYTAHKAANPERYPLKEETRTLYPAMQGIESRYGGTNVHLQVYDETCHVLPLYSFTTPAKYCYRAIATFCKFITAERRPPPTIVDQEPERTSETAVENSATQQGPSSNLMERRRTVAPIKVGPRASLLRRLTLPTSLRRYSLAPKEEPMVASPSADSIPSTPLATPISSEPPTTARGSISVSAFHSHHLNEVGTAGHPAVYACDVGGTPFTKHMIRERVATNGVIRPLEDEALIPACTMKLEDIGVLHEESVRRYLKGQAIWERKFAKVARSIEGQRQKHLNLSTKDTRGTMDKIRRQLHLVGERQPPGLATEPDTTADEQHTVDLSCVMEKTVLGSRQWKWGWALEGETPPPSSIVARGDTDEARRLGQFADRQLGPGDEEHSLSGNNLWSVVVEALTRSKPPQRGRRSSSQVPENRAEKAGKKTVGALATSLGFVLDGGDPAPRGRILR
ncbi:hypothetical protein FS837_005652 [Tulasnella sp. UAMH 9824]|nr:hypothetical protein FS837_005652 [Tulasnella sp. UAMH 9824]